MALALALRCLNFLCCPVLFNAWPFSPDWQTILPSLAFASLRDGESSSDVTVQARRSHYEANVFAPLVKSGAAAEGALCAELWGEGDEVARGRKGGGGGGGGK